MLRKELAAIRIVSNREFILSRKGRKELTKTRELAIAKLHLVHPNVPPARAGLIGDLLTPVRDRCILRGCVFLYPALRLDDPVDPALLGLLDGDPVRVVEANGAAGLEVIHPEAGTTLLLSGAKGSKLKDVGASL